MTERSEPKPAHLGPQYAAQFQDSSVASANRFVVERPWEGAVRELIPTYSTNRDFEPYDLVEELSDRGLFVECGRRETAPVPFSQPLDAYVESYHSCNGFSRERMDRQSAAAFEAAVREIASPYSPDGMVRGEAIGTVIWGQPRL